MMLVGALAIVQAFRNFSDIVHQENYEMPIIQRLYLEVVYRLLMLNNRYQQTTTLRKHAYSNI